MNSIPKQGYNSDLFPQSQDSTNGCLNELYSSQQLDNEQRNLLSKEDLLRVEINEFIESIYDDYSLQKPIGSIYPRQGLESNQSKVLHGTQAEPDNQSPEGSTKPASNESDLVSPVSMDQYALSQGEPRPEVHMSNPLKTEKVKRKASQDLHAYEKIQKLMNVDNQRRIAGSNQLESFNATDFQVIPSPKELAAEVKENFIPKKQPRDQSQCLKKADETSAFSFGDLDVKALSKLFGSKKEDGVFALDFSLEELVERNKKFALEKKNQPAVFNFESRHDSDDEPKRTHKVIQNGYFPIKEKKGSIKGHCEDFHEDLAWLELKNQKF